MAIKITPNTSTKSGKIISHPYPKPTLPAGRLVPDTSAHYLMGVLLGVVVITFTLLITEVNWPETKFHTTPLYESVYDNGASAAKLDITPNANPYIGTDEQKAQAWLDGYMSAKQKSLKH